MSGTLISPRHIIFANHYPIDVGAIVTFIDYNGNIVNRTLQSEARIYSSLTGYSTDIEIGLLDSDVPDTVAHYSILTSSQLESYLSPVVGVPTIWLDQLDKVSIGNLSYLNNTLCDSYLDGICTSSHIATGYNTEPISNPTRDLFYKTVISGDSGNPVFLAVNNQLTLISHHTSTGIGPDYSRYITEINTVMASLQGGSTPYQLPAYDTSCFSSINTQPSISSALFNINDNAVNGTIVGNVTATTSNSFPVVYSIVSGNTGGIFSIDSSTGRITVANSSALNFSTTPSYTLVVKALSVDGGLVGSNRYNTANVVIDIFPSPLTSQSSVLYFYSISDTNWGTVGNWYTDYNHTTLAGRIPSSNDAAIIIGTVSPNINLTSWVTPIYINAQLDTGLVFTGNGKTSSATIVGNVTFQSGTKNNGNITGNVTFNDSYNNTSGVIIGDVSFVSTSAKKSYNNGTINGNVTFNSLSCFSFTTTNGVVNGNVIMSGATGTTTFTTSCSWGTASGTVKGKEGQTITDFIFTGSSAYNNGTVPGNATFDFAYENSGTVTGNAIFKNITVTTTITFPDLDNEKYSYKGKVNGTIKGNEGQTITGWIFNDLSYNSGTISQSVIFNGIDISSKGYNKGIITSASTFNGNSYNIGTITNTGSAVFNDNSLNAGTILCNAIFNGNSGSYMTGSYIGNIVGDVVFNGSSYNNKTITGNVTLNDLSYNYGTIVGNVILNSSSTNRGAVNGNAIFNGNSSENYYTTNYGTVSGTKTRHYSITTDASTHNFITDGPWLVQADNSIITMSDRTKYNASTTFQTLNGGSFLGLVPLVSSPILQSVKDISATISSSILNGHVLSSTTRGFYYGLTSNYDHTISNISTESTSTFSETLSNGISCNRTYHYQVFATDSSGTSTSSDATFVTKGCLSRKINTLNSDVNTTDTVVTNQSSSSQSLTSVVEQSSTTSKEVIRIVVPNNNVVIVSTTSLPSISLTAYLKLGNNGTEVTKLQNFLINKGYSLPSGVTSYFGNETQSALSKYQKDNNIASTGTLGPITRNYINNNVTTTPVTSTSTTTKYIFNNNLKLNSVSEDVRQLQIYLNNSGFTVSETDTGSKGNESTFYGQKTVQAVKKLQEAHASEILTPYGFKSGTGMFYEGTRKWVNGN